MSLVATFESVSAPSIFQSREISGVGEMSNRNDRLLTETHESFTRWQNGLQIHVAADDIRVHSPFSYIVFLLNLCLFAIPGSPGNMFPSSRQINSVSILGTG